MSSDPILVAADFTGDRLSLLLSELEGEAILREDWPLPPLPDEDAWAWEVGGRISTAFAREGQQRWALGIGVACPGAVDPVTGRILRSTGQEAWDGLSVVEALRRHIDAPIIALNRTQASLTGEATAGGAVGMLDALYVSLRGAPTAALMVSGRIVQGAAYEAGSLPALPRLDGEQRLNGDALERAAAVLADASALLDPALIMLEGDEAHVSPLAGVLQRVIDEIGGGPRVVPAALGEHGALYGALQAASMVAYEGERTE